MILAPSPQTLLHKKNPNYVTSLMYDCNIQDCLRSFENDRSPKQGSPQPFIDLCFLTSGGENPKIRHSSYNSAFILHYVLKTMNPSVSLSFAQLSLQIGDIEEAMHFLLDSAKNGSIHAMCLMSYLYFNYRSLFFSTTEQSKSEAIKWILRAMRSRSEQSYYQLAEVLSTCEHNQSQNTILVSNSMLSPTLFYAKYVNFNQCVSSSVRVVMNLNYLLNKNKIQFKDVTQILHKLILYILSQGESSGLSFIHKFYSNDEEIMKVWKEIILKYSLDQEKVEKVEKVDLIEKARKGFIKDDPNSYDFGNDEYQFSEKMAASFDENISIYSTRVLSQLLSSVDPFKSFKTSVFILQRCPPDSNGPKVSHVYEVKYKDEQRLKSDLSRSINIRDSPNKISNEFLDVMNNQEQKNYYDFTKLDPYGLPKNSVYLSNGFDEKMIGYYPNRNKTWLLLKLFEYVSPKPEKRNIVLASQILLQIYSGNRYGIINSRLWQSKIKSKKMSDQIRCGFICLILKDAKSAFILFQRAAMQGSSLASLMCGVLLFHNDIDENTDLFAEENLSLAIEGKKDAISFFLRCTDDPIALLHLYLVFNDESYYDRAVSIIGIVGNIHKNSSAQKTDADNEKLKTDQNSSKNCFIGVRNLNEKYAPFEIVGDLFFNGVKFVQNLKVAGAFYAAAIDRAYKDEANYLNLLSKFQLTQS